MRDSDIISNSSSPTYNTNLDLINSPVVNEITTTSVSVDVAIAQLGVQPTSYSVKYQKLLSDGTTPSGSPTTITSVTKPILVTGLTAGSYYDFTVKS